MRHVFSFFLALALCSASLLAQTSCPPAKIPVSVILPNGRPGFGLAAGSLVAEVNGKPVAVNAIELDQSFRRIAIVLDDGGHVREPVWQGELAVIRQILSSARANDQFALLTVHGVNVESHFAAATAAQLAAQLGSLSEERKHAKAGPHDDMQSVAEVANWFDQPRAGDSILIVETTDTEDGSNFPKIAPSKLMEMLLRKQIRLFAIQFGFGKGGSFAAGAGADPTALNNSQGSGGAGGGRGGRSAGGNDSASGPPHDSLGMLAVMSGGFFHVEPSDSPYQEYAMTPERSKFLETLAGYVYASVGEFHAVELGSSPGKHDEELRIELSPAMRSTLGNARLYYPRQLASCGH